ncbi:MAG TPA: plasmid stabilization protein [Alphaproteobacteria bacterium]|nr:plasmid stabilization protein [Alphaproteobacteria bacterium]HAJ45917.1 plasmid stabilization protein [Alphaproteobacteria bacterium]
MQTVELSAKALKQLRSLPLVDRDVLLNKLQTFAQTGRGDVKKLKGSHFFRLRHGDWRAVFDRKDNVLFVLDIAHRRDIYK